MVLPNPLTFLALMLVGLYLSLWRANFLGTWLATWILAFLLPSVVSVALHRFGLLRPATIIVCTSIFEVALAGICWFLLLENLRERKFVVS
jgi:hypothetical protein